MQPVVVASDITSLAVTYLRGAIPDYFDPGGPLTVSNRVPDRDPWPYALVVVRRDGGAGDRIFDQPRLTIRVWGQSDADAEDLALAVKALIWAWPDGQPVTSVFQVSGPSDVTEVNGKPQRMITCQVQTRGLMLTPLP